MHTLKNYFLILLVYLISASEFVQAEPPDSTSSFSIKGASAHWILNNKLIWNPGAEASRFEIRYSRTADIVITAGEVSGGMSIELTPGGTLSDELADSYRHIADRPVFTINAGRKVIAEAVKGQIVAIAYNENRDPVSATRVQHPGIIDQYFSFNGVLGPV